MSKSTSGVVSVEFNRPADTTAYTAKDAISNSTSAPSVLTFANITHDWSQAGYITKARIMTNKATWASTNAAVFKLHLFHEAPTAINDNSPYTLLFANRTRRIGTITFSALSTEGTGSDCANTIWTGALYFESKESNNTIYGLLEVDSFSGTLTPDSAQTFYIELSADCA